MSMNLGMICHAACFKNENILNGFSETAGKHNLKATLFCTGRGKITLFDCLQNIWFYFESTEA